MVIQRRQGISETSTQVTEQTIDQKLQLLREDVDSFKDNTLKELKKERNNILGSLSLFVAFFTFISINITIFSKIDDIFTALITMAGMIFSISIMLLIFFLFLHYEKGEEIFKTQLFKILLGLIVTFLSLIITFYIFKISLSPSLENKVDKLEKNNIENITNFGERIKSLENENNILKQNLEQQITKEVRFQLLEQQFKNTSN